VKTHVYSAGSILIRDASPEDVDDIVSFSAAMAWETEHRRLDRERLRQGTVALLSTPSYGFFQVAETSGSLPGRRLVGQLMVTYEWSDWRNGVFWWIQSVYVDPGWRRQGVFRRMHDSLLALAKSRPTVCGVRLYVDKDNHIAQAAYKRVGLAPSSYAVYENDFRFLPRAALQDRPDEA
jgi:ribosomal protein S18 acetylase RimI-like enzyme